MHTCIHMAIAFPSSRVYIRLYTYTCTCTRVRVTPFRSYTAIHGGLTSRGSSALNFHAFVPYVSCHSSELARYDTAIPARIAPLPRADNSAASTAKIY